MNTIAHDVAVMARKLGFLSETGYRNFCIKEEYWLLCEAAKNTEDSATDVLFQLAEKYNLSYDSVRKIVYVQNFGQGFSKNCENEPEKPN